MIVGKRVDAKWGDRRAAPLQQMPPPAKGKKKNGWMDGWMEREKKKKKDEGTERETGLSGTPPSCNATCTGYKYLDTVFGTV